MANPIIEFSVDPTDGSGSIIIDIDNTDPDFAFNAKNTDGADRVFTIGERTSLYRTGFFSEITGRAAGTFFELHIRASSSSGIFKNTGSNAVIVQEVAAEQISNFSAISASWGALLGWEEGDQVYLELRIPNPALLVILDPDSVSNKDPIELYKIEVAGLAPVERSTLIKEIVDKQVEKIVFVGGVPTKTFETVTETVTYDITDPADYIASYTRIPAGNLDPQFIITASGDRTAVNGPNPNLFTDTINLASSIGRKFPSQSSPFPSGPFKALINNDFGSSSFGEVIASLSSVSSGNLSSVERDIREKFLATAFRQSEYLTQDENLLVSANLSPAVEEPTIPDVVADPDTEDDTTGEVTVPPLPPAIPLSRTVPFEPHPDGLIIGDASIGREERKSHSPCNAILPSVAVRADDTKHIAWQDDRDDNWEIYYKFVPNTSGLTDPDFEGFLAQSSAGEARTSDNPLVGLNAVEFIPSNTGMFVTSSDDMRIALDSDIVKDPDAFFDSEQINVQPGDVLNILAPKRTNDPLVDPFTASKFVIGVLGEYEIAEVLSANSLKLTVPITPDSFSSGLSEITIRTDNGIVPGVQASELDVGRFQYFYAITKKTLDGSKELTDISGLIGGLTGDDGELLDIPTGASELTHGLKDNAVKLTNDSGNSLKPFVICDDFGNTHVFWHDDRTGRFQIFWKVHNGAAWSRDVQLTFSNGIAQNVRAAVDPDGVITIVWEDSRSGTKTGPYNVYTAKLDSDTISAIASGFTDGLFGDKGGSSIYVGKDGMGVDKTTEDIAPLLISSFTESANFTNAKNPDIDIDSDGIAYIVWQQNVGELLNTEIFYASYNVIEDDPEVEILRVTNADGDSFMPRIEVDSKDNAHIVWHDNRTGQSISKNFEIFYAKYTNPKAVTDQTTLDTPPSQTIPSISGLTFSIEPGLNSSGQGGSDTRLTRSAFDSMWADIVIDAMSDIFVFFHSARTEDGTNDIYGIMFDVDTQSWGSSAFGGSDVRMTTRKYDSEHVAAVIDLAGDIGIVWHDNNDSGGQKLENEVYCLSIRRQVQHSIFNCSPLPLMSEIEGFSGDCGPDQNTLIIFKKEDGTLGEGPLNNVFRQKCLIIEIETSNPIAYIKNENDPEWSGPIDMQDNLLANGRVRINHCLSDCNGEKEVIFRFSDGESICEERAFKVFLLAELPIFSVSAFFDEELSIPYPVDDDGVPLIKAGEMHVKVTSSRPLAEPPVMDMFFSGGRTIYNIPTKLAENDSEVAAPDEPQVYVGKINIRKSNGVTSFDGEAFLRVRGKDLSGNIAGSSIAFDNSSTGTQGNNEFSILPILFNVEGESIGNLSNPAFRVLNRKSTNSAIVQQVGESSLELLGEKTIELSILESNTTVGDSITIEYSLAESSPENIGEMEIEFDVVFRDPSAFIDEDASFYFTIESSCGSQAILTEGRSIEFRAVHSIDSRILEANALDLSSGEVINRFKVIANYPSKVIDVYTSNPNEAEDPIRVSTVELDRTCDRAIINNLRWTLFSKSSTAPISVYIDNISMKKL